MSELTLDHFKRHEKENNDRFKELDIAINDRPTKEEMKKLLKEAFDNMMHSYFVNAGGNVKTWVVTAGIIIASIVAIITGFKTLLGFLGIIVTRAL